MKTLLIGNFGARNVGDELILTSALEAHPDAVVATADPTFSQHFVGRQFPTIRPFPTGLRSFLRFWCSPKFRHELWALRGQVSAVVFPGGGLFSIRSRAFWIWGMTVWWLRKYFPEAEIHFEHQGIDRPRNFFQRWILKKTFRNAAKISVRDAASSEVLRSLGIESFLAGDRVETWLSKSEKKASQKRLLLNARSRADFSDIVKKYPDHEKIFLAMELGDARFAPAKWEGQTICPLTAAEALGLFASAEMAVGERLHFLILANLLSAQTHLLREPYADKVRAFCEKEEIQKARI
ncbi:MAG: polysaccharide pyruvyl transferase family protein [Candidatus Gracilibacteria bacterium]|nr:polysaccharide pyruvyl transferase family protein [Candidatus Gracilibacteria bacterium]